MERKEILKILLENFKWPSTTCEETYLDSPYKKKRDDYTVSLDLTPYGVVSLMVSIEELFNIVCDEAFHCQKVGELIDYIVGKSYEKI